MIHLWTFDVDHCEMMDRMGLDQDSVMIIHMGVGRPIRPSDLALSHTK